MTSSARCIQGNVDDPEKPSKLVAKEVLPIVRDDAKGGNLGVIIGGSAAPWPCPRVRLVLGAAARGKWC